MLEDWNALGQLLDQGQREAEDKLRTAWRDALEQVLLAGGVGDDHAAWELVRQHDVDVDDGAAQMQLTAGALGPGARRAAEALAVWRELHAAWESATDTDEPWEDFRDAMAEMAPMVPDDALAELSAFATEANARHGTWPLVALGMSEGELVGRALDELSERSGIPRTALPAAPRLESPALALTESADALFAVADWVESCEAWARVLARLGLAR